MAWRVLNNYGISTNKNGIMGMVQKMYLSEMSLSRPKKEKYPLMYKVRVINQDGSSYFTRYHLPIGCIRLPVDPNSLTEEQMKARLKRQRNEKKIILSEYKEDVQFDRRAMANLMKKK
ncbi:large ribosomal subunit protein mL55 isoform X2 [Hydra vulgaris]|uniref:Large ribosomal subunit protein mL55 isoform X2 n=1 Tax=Hydra vulgaris TaxID=6087 RepID=A0ABM4BC78_HYDVU